MIRGQLTQYPELTQLASFGAKGDGWEWAASLSPAYRGVLLAELLSKAIAESSPHVAADNVVRLVNGWCQSPWYPHLDGLLSVLRELESRDLIPVFPGIELQLGWLLSRAPISRLLRLVNERIRQGNCSSSDVRALVNAIVTHWDRIPPPLTADINRVPHMIQPIPLTEGQPWRETRAWLEDKSFHDGTWSVRIMLTIGPTDEQQLAQDNSARPNAENSRDDEEFGELILVPRVDGGLIAPGTAEIQLSDERRTVSTTFQITTDRDIIQFWISIYQRQPTTLLQELKGTIELAESEEER